MTFLIQKGASVHQNSILARVHDPRANFIDTPLLDRIENILSYSCDDLYETSEATIKDLNEKKAILLTGDFCYK